MRSTSNSGVQGLNALRTIAVLLLMICGGLSVQGQTVFGRISGTVKDANGGSIPNATVTITNLATNLVRTATTDGDGFYTATNLPAGSYSVAAVGKGFKKAEQSGISVVADARLTVDITLEPGQVTETVQVSTVAGETVNTTSARRARWDASSTSGRYKIWRLTVGTTCNWLPWFPAPPSSMRINWR